MSEPLDLWCVFTEYGAVATTTRDQADAERLVSHLSTWRPHTYCHYVPASRLEYQSAQLEDALRQLQNVQGGPCSGCVNTDAENEVLRVRLRDLEEREARVLAAYAWIEHESYQSAHTPQHRAGLRTAHRKLNDAFGSWAPEPAEPAQAAGEPWATGDDMCGIKITDLRRCRLPREHGGGECRDEKSKSQPPRAEGPDVLTFTRARSTLDDAWRTLLGQSIVGDGPERMGVAVRQVIQAVTELADELERAQKGGK